MKKDNNDIKIFAYKSIFIFFLIYLLYNFTIGLKIDQYEKDLLYLKTDQGREILREKFRSEIERTLDKKQILDDEDKVLLRKFIEKIKKELY